jgi:hypothetical protein
MARFHFFTDIDTLSNQPAADAFGPMSGAAATQFRVTSLHRAAAGASPNAYAVCDGLLLAQDAGTDLLNLILKPTEQPPFAFPKIKFFVYRGVQKSSLVSGDEVAPATNNDLTKSIWDSQQARNASAGTSAAAPAEALGLGGGGGSIEDVFYREDASFQLPLVRSGWSFGQFDPAQFGFEIMVESIGFDPELPIVRTAENVISVAALPASPTQAQEFEHWHDKEAIQNYVDPSAFFGGFYFHTLRVKHSDGSVSKKKKNALYDDVLKGAHLTAQGDGVFFNRNKIYLDIRNEYNHSLNYFKNYGTYTNTDIYYAGDTIDPVTVRNYYASEWPLMVVDNPDMSAGNTNSKKQVIRLSLPDGSGDNPLPTLYVSAGRTADLYPREPKGAARLIDLTVVSGFTNEVSLAIPNRDGLSSTTAVSSYIKLKYFKRFDPAAAAPPASSGTVIRAGHYLDNLFAPFAMKIPFPGVAALKSVVYDEELFIDAAPLTGVFSTAKYEDQVNYTFLCLPKALVDVNPAQLITPPAVKSNEYGSYLEHLTSSLPGLKVKKSFLSLNQQASYLVAQDFGAPMTDFVNQRLDRIVTLSVPVAALPASTAASFHPKSRLYLALNNRQQAVDNAGQPYEKFDLYVRGYAESGGQIGVSEVPLNLTVYLKDNTHA